MVHNAISITVMAFVAVVMIGSSVTDITFVEAKKEKPAMVLVTCPPRIVEAEINNSVQVIGPCVIRDSIVNGNILLLDVDDNLIYNQNTIVNGNIEAESCNQVVSVDGTINGNIEAVGCDAVHITDTSVVNGFVEVIDCRVISVFGESSFSGNIEAEGCDRVIVGQKSTLVGSFEVSDCIDASFRSEAKITGNFEVEDCDLVVLGNASMVIGNVEVKNIGTFIVAQNVIIDGNLICVNVSGGFIHPSATITGFIRGC